MSTELRPDELFRRCDPSELPFASTADEPEPIEILGQERAVDAARVAIGIHRDGYNLFALGPHGVGKQAILRRLLESEAARQALPADWCHVYNFAEPRRPRALRLPPGTAARLRADVERAVAELRVAMPAAFESEEHRDALAALDREVAAGVARRVIETARAGYRELPGVLEYLAQVEQDIVAHADRFNAKSEEAVPEALRRVLHGHGDEAAGLRRYEVNVMVDHGGQHGAPVIYEENPTHANLVGRIDHVAELGALVTDLALIRPGALHRANGGYLILDAIKLLQQPSAWEGLKRALRTHEIRIDPLAQPLGLATAASLEPEPIPLDAKVILLGDRVLYYLLGELDPELADLFKVMADFEQDVDRSRGADASYAKLIAGLVRKEALRPFDRGAVARVIERASRLASDAGKLSIHLRSIVDLLREADYCAGRADRAVATGEDVQAAVDAQLRRSGRIREQMLEEIRREIVLIATSGEAIGQINGLSVVDLGGRAFGRPTRITALARVGDGKVIDIEREVDLGGPVHSKGVLILSGLFGARYAQRQPISLSATLVLEQSYGGVEGDSASLAELCALVSAIADVPLKQALAITGSVSQHGEVQPVGGVNEKIEGFFDVCRERGLTGEHGVVIPRGNVQHLMLREDVVAAVAERKFQVHAVSDIDEAIALVTGREAGVRDRDGHFPDGTVNALVEARLAAFTEDVRRFALEQATGRVWKRPIIAS